MKSSDMKSLVMVKYSVHCRDCDSTELTMLNANCTWDIETQKWIYSDNYDPIFQCSDCFSDFNLMDIVEKEIGNA